MKNRFKKIMAFLFLFLVFSCTYVNGEQSDEQEALTRWQQTLTQTLGGTDFYGDSISFDNMALAAFVLGYQLNEPGCLNEGEDGACIEYSRVEGKCDYETTRVDDSIDNINNEFVPGAVSALSTDVTLTKGIGTLTSASAKDIFMYAFGQGKTYAKGYVDANMTDEVLEIVNNVTAGDANHRLYQLMYEWCALELMESSIRVQMKNIQNAGCMDSALSSTGWCQNGETTAPFATYAKFTDYFKSTSAESVNELGNYQLDVNCPVAWSMYKGFEHVLEKISEMQSKINYIEKDLVSSGEADDALGDFVEDQQENTENATNEAENQFDIAFDEIIGEKPELTLENLTNRVTGLIGFGKLDGLDDITNFVAGDIVNLVAEVGKYIIYAAILFMGVRIIWSGAQGKAQFKEALPFLLTAIVFFYLGENIYYLIEGILYGDELNYAESVKTLWGSIIDIIRILAFGGIMFTGLKFLFASGPDGRADVKASLLPILIGCILVFASSTIVSVVINVSKESGLDQVSKEENTSENIFLDGLEYKIEV